MNTFDDLLSELIQEELGFDDLSAKEQVEKFMAAHDDGKVYASDEIVYWMTNLFLEIHRFGYQLRDERTLEDLQEYWRTQCDQLLDKVVTPEP